MNNSVSASLKKIMGRKAFSYLKKTLDMTLSYKKSTYSQFGEDQYLKEFFKNKNHGFFVDVGAYHPRQFSNTYLLYKKGWNGINIDATPGSMTLFKILRPRDKNYEIAISDSKQSVQLSAWGTDSENTLHRGQSEAVQSKKGDPVAVVKLEPHTLTEILDGEKNIPADFDLLNVDVEGWDMAVLQSLDWDRYSPKIVMVELFADNLDEILKSEMYMFLKNKNYILDSWYKPTLIFRSQKYH